MASGFAQGSRWGLKGTGDPGGGYSALFQLENGFNVNNGTLAQGGRMFGRQAYVAGSARFGTLTLGRQYDAVVDYLAPTTANGSWGVYPFSHPLDNDNTGNTFRVNNTVKYAAGFRRLFVRRYVQLQQRHGLREQPAVERRRAVRAGRLAGRRGVPECGQPGRDVGRRDRGRVGRRRCELCVGAAADFRCGHQLHGGPATVGFAYTNSNVTRPTANVGYLFGDETIEPVTGPLAGARCRRSSTRTSR